MNLSGDDATPLPRTFALTRGRRLLNLLILTIGIVVLAYAAWSATRDDARALLNALALAGIALFVIYVALSSMVERFDVRPWSLDHRFLFGRRHIEIRDVIHLSLGYSKMWKVLTIKTDRIAVFITNQTVSNQDLDELAEFIYAGGEATANAQLKRPVAQKKFADFAKGK